MRKVCTVAACEKLSIALGLCPMHRWRLAHYGSLDKPDPPTTAQRFWEKVRISDDPSGCWLWTGAITGAGYGNFNVGGASWVPAHRWAYENIIGPIPDGLDLDHLCRVRSCVRHDHLDPVTRAENLRRGIGAAIARERAKERTQCRRGHPVTDENVYASPLGVRTCKPCRRESGRRYDAKRRNFEIIGEVEE